MAGSAQEALQFVEAAVPDVIVTDLMMPGVDGLELCRRLRAAPSTRRTPIVVVTALGSREAMARAMDAGATDFISKPVNGVEVRARIRSMVRMAREYGTMQQLLSLRTDLTNMVVHDLRNPLQVITFSLALLQRSFTESPPALERIRTQVQRLQHLINDLLVIAKSEAGVLVAHRRETDGAMLVSRVLEDCRPAALTAEITLVEHVESTTALFVDPDLLRRCIENLVLNAIKFSGSGSTVTIDLTQREEGLRIDVADDGPGIPADLQGRVFGRFATSERQGAAQQTGLGLAFCRMVAEAHEGTITLLPNEGTGSVFRFWCPSITPGGSSG